MLLCCGEQIQAIRSKHDKAHPRWPPHVNLLYPFLPEAEFEAGVPALQAAVEAAGIRPFRVDLREFGTFDHGKQVAVWLRPEDGPGGGLTECMRLGHSVFPFCDDAMKRGEFVPHLSVGQCPRGEYNRRDQAGTRTAPIAALQEGWSPLSFQCDRLSVIARRGFEDPFQVVHEIMLVGAHPGPLPEESEGREEGDTGPRGLHLSPKC